MTLDHARELRRFQAEAEKRLWSRLRASRFFGWKFKRQQPLGSYIVDFVCLEARLIIEADGGQHNGSAHDEARDAWLNSRGYRVLRFWNNDVLGNTEGVLEAIRAALQKPSPLAGEGGA